ncbi:phage tail sheath C-terminal domain-containing protein [Devosia ginsengisoli]|uniref:phage tail sheath C-terminal domain-containing protein n=1 Tax=Devosia ginsengisoli TaxID=400770 RepID=UPI0026ECFEEE|nr:phage tail sheath C-terminal domain-containing protein [Devosia ginsengisoli]MCR6673224.1 phage tail protein [Devosia ginsengisoli]
MTDPVFGISITRDGAEPRPAVGYDMSVIGLVGTAPAATAEVFPLNTPVLLNSDDAALLLALGATGTLPPQFDLINSQLGEFQVSARVVVVRVEAGADDDETIANIVGSAALKTGLYALKEAGPALGVVPRLIGVPGYTHQRETGVATITVAAGGADYEVGDAITGTGGSGSGFAGEVATVDGEGAILTVTITSGGSGYTGAPALSVTSDAGEGATLTATVDDLANVVCAALPPICSALIAHAVVTGPHSTRAAYSEWRETLQSDRLIPVETWAKVGSPATDIDSVGLALGIGVRRDHEKGGLPFHSWANQPCYGIVGPNRNIEFSLTDGSTEGQEILAENGGIIVRGEAGVADAIASGGFVFIGTDNAGEDELWRFYSVTRGRDYIHLLMLRTLRFYLGRYNLNGQTIEAVVETMKSALRDLQAQGAILGYRVGFDAGDNSAEQLRQGKFNLTFKAEEAPVLRRLGLTSARYRPALDTLLSDLLSQMDAAA